MIGDDRSQIHRPRNRRPERRGPFLRAGSRHVIGLFIALAILAFGAFLLWQATKQGSDMAEAVLRLWPL